MCQGRDHVEVSRRQAALDHKHFKACPDSHGFLKRYKALFLHGTFFFLRHERKRLEFRGMRRQHYTRTRAKQDGHTESRQLREVGLTTRHMLVVLRD
jgi:hypothetical protein